MSYRVIRWAPGNLGRAAIEGIIGHPDLELAGVWCVSAVPYVCEAAPGIRTYLDLPSIAGRAARFTRLRDRLAVDAHTPRGAPS